MKLEGIHRGRNRFCFFIKVFFVSLILCISTEFEVKSQVNTLGEIEDTSFHYDEINVLVIIEGYGNFFSDVIYTDHDLLFINIEDLFKTIKIPCIVGQKGDSIGGFIDNESHAYNINYNSKQIIVGGKTIHAKRGLIKESGSVFMESSLFVEVFGITLTFNYRSLTVILKSNFELPVIKEARLEKQRNNLAKLKGEFKADTNLHRDYHLFKAGNFDWTGVSTQIWKGLTENHLTIGAGAELLFGEATASINYDSQLKLDNRELHYLWHWVDNDNPVIKQAQVGTIQLQTISLINTQTIGVNFKNSPTTVRKAKGYYPIHDYTEPNWTVELYLNDVLMDFTRADAAGLYDFKVPIVYGTTTLKLKFYGPMGEERTEERTLFFPFTIMPVKEFEYNLSAGILQDSLSSRFGQAGVNYGVTRFLTAGAGVEYLSSITTGAFIPYAKVTIHPFSRLLVNGEYDHGVETKGVLNYYFLKDAFLEIDYAKYFPGQLAIPYRSLEERKAKLSLPWKIKKIGGSVKLDYSQLVYKVFNYNQANIALSLYFQRFNVSSSTQISWADKQTPYSTSDLSLMYRMKYGYNIRLSGQYNVNSEAWNSFKTEFEKRISKAYISVSYERNILYRGNSVNLNFRYELPFARTNFSGSYNTGIVSTSEGAQGSLQFGSGNKYINASNNLSVGKGGIALYPFLDLNNNGIFDPGEPMVKITSVRVMGSNVIFREKDSIVRIPELNGFIKYIVEFSDEDLPNIAWRYKKKVYSVLVDPDQFKRVDIPIIIVGEMRGMAYTNKDSTLKGTGRILVKIYKKNTDKIVAEALSESDGYIDYMGLEPGDYVVRVDSTQLINLNSSVEPLQREFTIKAIEDGDIVEGIDFVLNPNEK